MKLNFLSKLTATALTLAISVVASHAALTTTIIGAGVPGSTTSGDTANGTAAVTLSDSTASGDFWEGGDEGVFLRNTVKITGNFTATVRIIGQTAAANGNWGKAGIAARNGLTATDTFAMAQVAAGNGTQPLPAPGGANPVPVRLAGRIVQGATGGGTMFEDNIAGTSNNTFRTDGGVNITWLRLDYNAATNGFRAGVAADVAGVAGPYTFGAFRTNIPDANPADGWWVGLAYSAHADMSLGTPPTEGLHGVTFEKFTIIPEPSTALLGSAVAGMLALRRRRRR